MTKTHVSLKEPTLCLSIFQSVSLTLGPEFPNIGSARPFGFESTETPVLQARPWGELSALEQAPTATRADRLKSDRRRLDRAVVRVVWEGIPINFRLPQVGSIWSALKGSQAVVGCRVEASKGPM